MPLPFPRKLSLPMRPSAACARARGRRGSWSTQTRTEWRGSERIRVRERIVNERRVEWCSRSAPAPCAPRTMRWPARRPAPPSARPPPPRPPAVRPLPSTSTFTFPLPTKSSQTRKPVHLPHAGFEPHATPGLKTKGASCTPRGEPCDCISSPRQFSRPRSEPLPVRAVRPPIGQRDYVLYPWPAPRPQPPAPSPLSRSSPAPVDVYVYVPAPDEVLRTPTP
jgi:hypothetical protein